MQQLIIRIKKPNMSDIAISIVFLLVYFDSTVFAVRYRDKMILLIIVCIYFLVTIITKRTVRKLQFVDLYLLLLVAVVLLNNNYDFKLGEPTYEVLSVLAIFLVIFEKENIAHYIDVFMNFIYVFGLAAAFLTIICFIYPDFYIQNIFPLADQNAKLTLLYTFQQGYQSGFALHYSSNGIYLALFSGTIFCKWIDADDRKTKLKYFGITTLALVALFLTAKRAHTVFSVFAMFVVYYYSLSGYKKTRTFKIFGFCITIAVVFSIISQVIPEVNNVFLRFVSSSTNSESIFGGRIVLYEYALFLFIQNPILGNGWNSYKYFAESGIGEYIAAHNVFLQLLSETGVMGFVLFVSFMVLSLVMIIRQYINVVKNKKAWCEKEKNVPAFSLFFQVFFLLYCFTGNPLYESMLIVPFYLICCLPFCRKPGLVKECGN